MPHLRGALSCLLVVTFVAACSEPTATPLPATSAPPTVPPTVESPTAGPPTPTGTTSYMPFDKFLAGVEEASYETYSDQPDSRVVDAQSFEAMRAHILRMYDGAETRSSFVVEGQTFDCIIVDTQPTVRLLGLDTVEREAPTGSSATEPGGGEAPGEGTSLESPLTLGNQDAFGNDIACEEGAIPMARLTLETMTRFATLDDFFGKGPGGAGELPTDETGEIQPEGDSTTHKYAYARRNDLDNFGGNSWLNLWNPTGGFSLSQQWYAGGSGSTQQTVEGGWVVYETKFNTKQAVLFIFYTADNYQKAKCYNLDCAAFVQTNNHWYLGGPWSSYSATGATQWGFELQWKLFHGNWWLFLKGPGSYEAVGYYPTSIFSGGQLSKNATEITYGGETAGTKPYPQMGSGAFANQGWQRAAFQNTIFYIPRDEDDGTGVWADLTANEPSPGCYTIDLVPASSGGSWGTYFFFGGPGGNGC